MRLSFRLQRSTSSCPVPSRTFDVARVRTGADSEPQIAKCTRAVTGQLRESLRAEYAALQDLNRRAGVALAGTIPRPISLEENDGILRMSEVPGIPLSQILQRQANFVLGSLNVRRMRKYGAELGRWLSTFHQTTAGNPCVRDHLKFMADFDASLVRSKEWLSARKSRELRQQVEAASQLLGEVTLDVAAMHGDFTPQNILFNRTSAGVVDFASYRATAPIYRDLATFIAYIALLASKSKYHATALGILLKHFLSSYGGNWEPGVLTLFVLNAMLRITNDGPEDILTRAERQRIERVMSEALDKDSWLGKIVNAAYSKVEPPSLQAVQS